MRFYTSIGVAGQSKYSHDKVCMYQGETEASQFVVFFFWPAWIRLGWAMHFVVNTCFLATIQCRISFRFLGMNEGDAIV